MVISAAEASHLLAIVKIKAKEYGKGLILLSIRVAVPILNTMFVQSCIG